MTDQTNNADNDLVLRGVDGDPLPRGTAMTERESYERVVEGLKLAADAARHLAARENDNARWIVFAHKLDLVRRQAVELGRIEDVISVRQGEAPRGVPLGWSRARRRLREGLKQAGGGMRQLATCHRGDLRFSRMAATLEHLVSKLTGSSVPAPGDPRRIIRPEGILQ